MTTNAMEDMDRLERVCLRAEAEHACLNCGGPVEAHVNKNDEIILRCDAPQTIGSRSCGWNGTAEERVACETCEGAGEVEDYETGERFACRKCNGTGAAR